MGPDSERAAAAAHPPPPAAAGRKENRNKMENVMEREEREIDGDTVGGEKRLMALNSSLVEAWLGHPPTVPQSQDTHTHTQSEEEQEVGEVRPLVEAAGADPALTVAPAERGVRDECCDWWQLPG